MSKYQAGKTQKIAALSDVGVFASIDDQSVVGRVHCWGVTQADAECLRDRLLLSITTNDDLVVALRNIAHDDLTLDECKTVARLFLAKLPEGR